MPSSHFQDAANYLSQAKGLSKLDSDTKLNLYGLYKYVSLGSGPTQSRPSIFEFTERAKWDAWKSVATSGLSVDDAEKEYVDMAHNLGWSAQADQVFAPTLESSASEGFSLGYRVSTMVPPAEDYSSSLHSIVLANDVTRLATFLEETNGTTVNTLDEFGYAPLHLAADRGHIDSVRMLLDHGADLSLKDPDDFTAIELARIGRHLDIIKMLEPKIG